MARTGLAAARTRALSCVLLSCLAVVLAAAGVAAAQPCDPGDGPACEPPTHTGPAGGDGREEGAADGTAGQDTADEDTATMSLEVSPVLDGAPDGGDLVRDPETGLATLTFMPTGPGELLAVHDYTVANTGTALLREVTLVTDGAGTAVEVGALAAGEHRVVRVGRTFTFAQVAGGLAGVLEQGASATGHVDGDVTVTAEAASPLQLVAVLASPRLGLVTEVVVGAGDVTAGTDGAPTVTWSAREAAAGAARSVRYRLTLTNLGTTLLRDLDVVDPMLDPDPIPVDADGEGLAPGESVVLEADHLLDPASVLPVGTVDGSVEEDVRNVTVARGRDEAGAVVAEATAEALVRARVAAPTAAAEVLPAAGLTASPGLFAVALLLTSSGAAAVRGTRSRPGRSAAGERR